MTPTVLLASDGPRSAAGWSIDWSAAPGGDGILLLIGAILVAGAGAALIYRRDARGLSMPLGLTLAGLRWCALIGVVLILLEPVLRRTRVMDTPSTLPVLVDASESMTLRDCYTDPEWAPISRALRTADATESPDALRTASRGELAGRALSRRRLDLLAADGDRTLALHRFAERLSPASSLGSVAPAALSSQPAEVDHARTALGGAIDEALAQYRGLPLAGLLLVSDGQNNAGPAPAQAAERAAARGVPIHVLAVGSVQGPRNVRLVELNAAPVAFVQDPITMEAIITGRGMEGETAAVILESRHSDGAWRELERATVQLGPAGSMQAVPFTHSEAQPTELELRARLAGVADELTGDDNAALASVRVVRRQIRALLIAGIAFPEVQFLRNALTRDPGIDLSYWLMAADRSYQPGGDRPIEHLPADSAELNEYDCVILYDPDPTRWPPDFPRMLADFVGQAAGGLIYVAGESHTERLLDPSNEETRPLRDLLPVVRDPGLFRSEVEIRLSARQAWKLEITPEGTRDALFAFAADPAENERVLDGLPGMYWYFPVTRAKPGATVLARHADPRMANDHGRHVMLATHFFGPGRAYFLAFDSTYRWRYLDEQYFDGFWARLVDRAGRAKALGGRYPFTLSTDRAAYEVGSRVDVAARFTSAEQVDPGFDVLRATVERAGDAPFDFVLQRDGAQPGVYRGSFTAARDGVHVVRVWPGERDESSASRPATLEVTVATANPELDAPAPDRATLRAIAEASGGRYFELADLDELPDAFAVRRVSVSAVETREIWDGPWIAGAVLLLIFTEWVIRKRLQMV